jgi:hypothetical protein
MNGRLGTGVALAALVAAAAPAAAAPLGGRNGVSLALLVATRPVADGLAYDPPAAASDTYLAHLRASGADLVRLVIRPAPMITGSPAARQRALAQVVAMVRRLGRARLTTIVDLHFWPPDTAADEAGVECDPTGRAGYRTMLTAVADALGTMPSGTVALELLNEPKPCKVDGQVAWPRLQQDLVAAIRARQRTLPLIVTGTIGALDPTGIDPAPYRGDTAILYSWHFYDPFVFTHQQIYYKLEGVPWPAPGTLVAGMRGYAAIDRSKADWAGANTLRKYLTTDGGAGAIHDRFAAVARWAARNGIPPANIVIGEYGVPLQENPASEALRDDKVRWLATVRQDAARAGFRTIYWIVPLRPNYDYSQQTGFLRPEIARAIGLSTP